MAEEHRNPVTMSRYILTSQKHHPNATGDFTILISSIQLACKVISNACSKAGIFRLYGLDGSENSSGDAVKKLDVFANDSFIDALTFCNQVSIMVSEENDEPIYNPSCTGKYFVAFDPLDGSSNIDANVSIGTIFGIWMNPEPENPTKMENVYQPGSKLVAAGYALYGAASMMVLSFGDGVQGFTLDPSLGEYILTHRDIKCPTKGQIFSINEGNASTWDAPTAAYIRVCKGLDNGAKPKSARYVGSMVADIHRTLLYGGIFMYPGSKSVKRVFDGFRQTFLNGLQNPKGKLRLMYEGAPMAFIVEQAGGKATTGKKRILDLTPKSLHETCPIFIGSADDVDEIQKHYTSG